MSGRRRNPPGTDAVQAVTARLAAAPKYRAVHPDTIADVVRREGENTADPGELERLSRARLHKVAALHLVTIGPAALRRSARRPAPAGPADPADPGQLRAWCRQMLAAHVSTAERLADLDLFYPAILRLVPPPRTVADIACAMNVFTVPWLRDCCDARYTGYDLNATFAALGSGFLSRDYPGCAVLHRDVLTEGPPPAADLALLLKTYHCMEDRRRGAGLHLVDSLAAGHVVVSFPTRAMNGRTAVFARRHVSDLATLATQRGWRLSQVTLPSEELLVIAKGSGPGTGSYLEG